MPAGSSGPTVAGALAGGLFRPLAVNATAFYNDSSMGERLYMNTYFLNLGTPSSANVFQIKFLEPILDNYFTQRGGDKLDTTAKPV
jgi:hypothetical protein